MRKPSVMMTHTSNTWELTGDPVKGDGWFGHSGGIHTISIMINNFIGAIAIEATLSINPQESDWFSVPLNTEDQDENGLLIYPLIGAQETTGNFAYTFSGNYVWLRARLVRNYISDVPLTNQDYGSINRILLAL